MKQTIYGFITIATFLLLSGCGGGGGSNNTNTPDITLSGTLKYERIPVQSSGIGLDYNHILTRNIKLAKVEAIDTGGKVLASTVSSEEGIYSMVVPGNTRMKVRVYAQTKKNGTPSWDVKVLDNTDGDSLYVMEGALSATGTTNSTRNLTADSGWDSNGNNVSPRVAAPFAILDNIYTAMQKVLLADPNISFPALSIHWSPKNVPSSSFDPASGQIITSLYSSGNLYILGAKDLDTDEYDDHIITHEWGHYYEDKFSRADSIGGSHSDGDYLDIRVAFSEGFGNAFSAIALDEPLYFDSMGSRQSSGFSFNMENGPQVNPGWFSEGSVQRILYDLYDANDDGADDISMGFAPLHKVFIGAQKQTGAFTSLFSFITALKAENDHKSAQIDALDTNESIAVITDVFGRNRTNLTDEEPYIDLSSSPVCTSTAYGARYNTPIHNNLSNHKYVKFHIQTDDVYTITMKDTNASRDSDPDFVIYKSNPSFQFIDESFEINKGIESDSFSLKTGEYLLDVSDWKLNDKACFTITID